MPAPVRNKGLSVPGPLAVLSWVLGGVFSLFAAGLGTAALQANTDISSPALALFAGGFLLLATFLVLIAVASLPHRIEPLRSSTRLAFGLAAVVGLLMTAFVFAAAAPGGLAFDDSWGWAVAATVGIWLAISALARLREELCWGVIGAACIAILLASGVTNWE